MRSGLPWREDHTEYQVGRTHNWVRAILERPLTATPGTDAGFTYSTGNTHVLSAVLQAATGMSTCDFARRHVFTPLGITAEHWGRDPMAVVAGGYNLYLRPRELAKIGQLYLNDGRWGSTRALPAATVRQAATDRHSCDRADHWCYTHGWWWKSYSGHDTFVAFGFGGQMVSIPDLDIVFSQTQDTRLVSRESDHEAFVTGYLLPAVTTG